MVAVQRLQQGGDRDFGGEGADESQVGRDCDHRLMDPAGSVVKFLIGLGVHGSTLSKMASQAQQASEARRRTKPNDFAHCAMVKHARQNCWLGGPTCHMADNASGRDSVCGTQHQIHVLNQAPDEMSIIDNV